jgi:hypothetical protein
MYPELTEGLDMRFGIILFFVVMAMACSSTPIGRQRSLVLNPALTMPIGTTLQVPTHWRPDGTADEVAMDPSVSRQGMPSYRVKFKEGAPYAGLVQRIPAEALVGSTLVVDAWLARSTEQASAGVWIRAFDKDNNSIAYANSYEMPLPPIRDLHQHVFEFLVPPATTSLLVGASIYGESGTAWFNSVDVYVSNKR